MPITKLTPENNYPYQEDRLKALEQAVPEAFADGKINWQTLKEVLEADLEDESKGEFFGLNWPGKREARRKASIPSQGTLIPAPGEGINEENTENLFIEGDNLEVLKLLQKSYAGKIKMIYIDPPYNTGNDFIYNDNFTDPLEAYLKYTGAKDESGELLTTNTRAEGRFHSKWLNMMYPRLILARQLLRNDGIIFVSIDENEVTNLRQMMNEVFGEENFVASIIWQKKFARQNDAVYFSTMHDYILCFSKVSLLSDSEHGFKINLLPRTEESNSGYSNPDNDSRGDWTSVVLSAKSGSEKLRYRIITPSGRECYPPDGRFWAVTEEKFWDLVNDNRIWFGKSGDGIPRLKTFLCEVQEGLKPNTIWFHEEVSHNQAARQYLKELFDGEAVFDSPKPVELLMQMIHIASSNKDEIFLDFFAGSGTLAEAIFEKNKTDNGKRKFILIQLPEKTDKHNYPTITEIGKDRIRRNINRIVCKKDKDQLPLINSDMFDQNLGFRVFQYTKSNYKTWNSSQGENAEALTPLFDNFSNPLIQGWKKENLLNELLLLEGFPLTSKITLLEDNLKNEVYKVSAPDFCTFNLFMCLDGTIQPSTIDLITMGKDDIFISLDNAMSDELKARVQDKFNVHVI